MDYPVPDESAVRKNFDAASEVYAAIGVDVKKALSKLKKTKISLHCWQGDDVGGFENPDASLSGGIMATGNFPGKARNPGELRQDLDKALSFIPGKHRVNLHAIYLENNGKFVDRDQVGTEHFAGWLEWAKAKGLKLDFNPTFFSHPKAASGFTLSNADKGIRDFWIEHARRCRHIAAHFAKELEDSTVINFWVPDGSKDLPADRWSPRKRLVESYDAIFSDKVSMMVKDAVEGKLFGLGSEEYVPGSNEFYLAYAVSRKIMPCMDMGHYHPTETIHDKLSAVLSFIPEVLVHVSRPIRWDSDHVVIFNDDIMNLSRELVRGDALERVYLALDYFDASINRIAAWTIGARSFQKSLLFAMLEPVAELKKLESEGCNAEKLALMEESKSMPFGAVWDYFCLESGAPAGMSWLNDLKKYEKDVLSKRS